MSIRYLKLTGSITAEDLINNLISTDSGDCQRRHWLVDTLDCHFDFRFEDIEAMISRVRSWPEACCRGVRIALYAKADVTYGLARIIASMADNIGVAVAVYREFDEAEAYLVA